MFFPLKPVQFFVFLKTILTTSIFPQTLEQCGGIDILVSNAAVNPFFGNILDSTDEVWTKVTAKPLSVILFM